MDATDDVVPHKRSVGHEGATMDAAAVEHRVAFAVWPPDHDEIDIRNEGVGDTSDAEFAPVRHVVFPHEASSGTDARGLCPGLQRLQIVVPIPLHVPESPRQPTLTAQRDRPPGYRWSLFGRPCGGRCALKLFD